MHKQKKMDMSEEALAKTVNKINNVETVWGKK